jgi:hypothetical protein
MPSHNRNKNLRELSQSQERFALNFSFFIFQFFLDVVFIFLALASPGIGNTHLFVILTFQYLPHCLCQLPMPVLMLYLGSPGVGEVVIIRYAWHTHSCRGMDVDVGG